MRGSALVRKASVVVLLLVMTAVLGSSLLSSASASSFFPLVTKGGCYYAGELYSYNACRGGQRCLQDHQGEYYWGDDSACDSLHSGPWGRPVI